MFVYFFIFQQLL